MARTISFTIFLEPLYIVFSQWQYQRLLCSAVSPSDSEMFGKHWAVLTVKQQMGGQETFQFHFWKNDDLWWSLFNFLPELESHNLQDRCVLQQISLISVANGSMKVPVFCSTKDVDCRGPVRIAWHAICGSYQWSTANLAWNVHYFKVTHLVLSGSHIILSLQMMHG